MQKSLVIGYGVSGKATVALLKKLGMSFSVVDRNAVQIQEPDLDISLDYVDYPLRDVERVILSPGIPPHHPLVERARSKGIEITGEIEFAFRYVRNRCIGVTGTNGKTTVATLVAHVLNAAGKRARAVGNVGAALSEYLLQPDEEEILVVELSSFQLETLSAKKLQAAVILNITPDHLDRYPSMKDYGEAKARIQDCLTPNGKLFVSKSVPKELFHVPVSYFDADVGAASFSAQFVRSGAPERQNVEAAFALCREFGVEREGFDRAVATFQKPAHRIEWVGEWRGVQYYDDSKATNIDSVMHAMALFNSSVILILGGVDKGASYRPWIDAFQGKVRKMVAYGQAAAKMEAELGSHFAFSRVATMEEAVRLAKIEAKTNEIVLLSPGCSSYDQFRNYAHRGDEFKRLVKELP